MGVFSNFTRSWRKSIRLTKLQKAIAPANESIDNMVANAMQLLMDDETPKERALEEYLDMCESDEGVKQVMALEHLSRSDLKQLYMSLSEAGLGQYIKGHHAALSTIAYVEPLQYAVRAQQRGVEWPEIVSNLLDYWGGKIPSGSLARQIR